MASAGRGGNTARIVHSWATDYDADSCETYRANVSSSARVLCRDVRKVDFGGLPPVDGLSFGFPCNDFSIVGEQKGVKGKFGPLYLECVRALEECGPLWFVAENVGGLSSSNEGRAFQSVLKALAQAGDGYRLVPHLYKFEHYGIPQKRHRIIIVGLRNDLEQEFRVPAPTHHESGFVTAQLALEASPPVETLPNSEQTRQSSTVGGKADTYQAGRECVERGSPGAFETECERSQAFADLQALASRRAGLHDHGFRWWGDACLSLRGTPGADEPGKGAVANISRQACFPWVEGKRAQANRDGCSSAWGEGDFHGSSEDLGGRRLSLGPGESGD